ncbi:hypothetical protein U1Q18_041335 [Sarracenia purpurea var. burkii]
MDPEGIYFMVYGLVKKRIGTSFSQNCTPIVRVVGHFSDLDKTTEDKFSIIIEAGRIPHQFSPLYRTLPGRVRAAKVGPLGDGP